MTLGRTARLQLRARRFGVLSTHSRAVEGYPYGSIAPYVLDAAACPVLLVSRLAEHTMNFTADPRVSLLVLAPGSDPQEEARVTLLGRIARVARGDAAQNRYLALFPDARDYLQLDFEFVRIEPVSLRVIAGFAKAHWVSREAYAPPAGEFCAAEAAAVARLNAMHGPALLGLCATRGSHPVQREIVGLDCDGFDVRADHDLLRFDFDRCVSGTNEACTAVDAMIRRPRLR